VVVRLEASQAVDVEAFDPRFGKRDGDWADARKVPVCVTHFAAHERTWADEGAQPGEVALAALVRNR